jgi:TolA-binding protein
MCFNRGLHFVHEGDFQSAKREFQACLSYCPRDDEAQLLLGKTYWAAGEKRNARRAWKMLIANTSNASMAEKAELCLKAAANRSRQRKNEIDIPNTELPKDTLSVLKEKNTKI